MKHAQDVDEAGDPDPAAPPNGSARSLRGASPLALAVAAAVVVVLLVVAVRWGGAGDPDAAPGVTSPTTVGTPTPGGPPGGPTGGSTGTRPGGQAGTGTAATSTTERPPPPEHTVTVYGAEGTFRELTPQITTTSTGHDIGTVAVAGWGFDPGASAFFNETTAGGRVLFSTVPQTDNQARPTGATMSLGVLDPTGPAGPTFQSLRVPTTKAATELTKPGQPVGGADVSDLCTVAAPSGPTVYGTSALPYKDWNFNLYGWWPALAAFHDNPAEDGAGAVTYDPAASRTPDDLRDDEVGKLAFPVHENEFGSWADTRGLGECDVTAAGFVVASQYFFNETGGSHAGSLVAFDNRGQVLAFMEIPRATTQQSMSLSRQDGSPVTIPAGTVLELSPREVRADPHTTAPADQRFVVVYDANAPDPDRPGQQLLTPFALQEFRLDAIEGTIAATSDPLVTNTAGTDGMSDGTLLRPNSTVYAPDGTLFVTRSPAAGTDSLLAAPMAVFRPGSLAERPGRPAPWGVLTRPDAVLTSTSGGRNPLTTVRSINYDTATNSVVMVGGVDARLRSFRWNGWDGDPGDPATPARPETTYCDVDLGGTLLANPTPGYRMQVRQGSIDEARQIYYVTYQGLQPALSSTDNETLPQYAFAVRLDSVLSDANQSGRCPTGADGR